MAEGERGEGLMSVYLNRQGNERAAGPSPFLAFIWMTRKASAAFSTFALDYKVPIIDAQAKPAQTSKQALDQMA